MVKFKSVLHDVKGENVFLRGTTQWAHVHEADAFGDFSITIYPKTHEMMEDFIKKCEVIRDNAVKIVEEKGKVIKEIKDIFKYDSDGDRCIKAKIKVKEYPNKPDNVIEFYDFKGNRDEDFSELIGNGSEIVARLYVRPYYMESTKSVGVSIKLYAIQILNLVEFRDSSAGGFQNMQEEITEVIKEEEKEEGFPDFSDMPDEF